MKGKSPGALRVFVLLAASTPAIAQYVGTSPAQPGGPPATPSTVVSGDFSIYPKNGQTHDQQSADLYQCYSWAKGQTGFDPTQANGGVASDQVSSRREQYRRAMTVCLRARGYDVRESAPVASAPQSLPPATYASSPLPLAVPAGTVVAGPEPLFTRPELKYQPLAVQIEGGYTATAGTTNNELNGGGNVGLGLTWFPSSSLPIGIRGDGSYSWFNARPALLDAYGDYSVGHVEMYGGDADLQLDLAHKSPYAKLYLLGGVGRYRQYTTLKQISLVNGIGCFSWFYCGPAQFPAVTGVDRFTSPWLRSWNAGLGAEFAAADHVSFFVEARYLRILPNSSKMQFVPIRVGLRF